MSENLPFPRPKENYEFPDPRTENEKKAFRTKGASKFYDPCGPANQASMKCLDRNHYDKSKCQEAFDAYKECKRMWVGVFDCHNADSRCIKRGKIDGIMSPRSCGSGSVSYTIRCRE